jgi:peptidoglycan/xylan/chitin deacetylase (PgdA/CDA1 family)
MSQKKTNLYRSALTAIHYSGLGQLASPLTRGRGVIFMLHHVRARPARDFEPNRILAVNPDFLESLIQRVLAAGYETIPLDALPQRLAGGEADKPFACFTFDDGYRDNRDVALPILRKFNVPMTIYVPSDFADGEGELWWLTLEEVMRRRTALDLMMEGKERHFDLVTAADKDRAFEEIYWWLRRQPEHHARRLVAVLGNEAGIAPTAFCRDLVMTWDELRELAADPLVTIGAHTRRHYAVAKLAADEARAEISEGVRRIESELGRPCRHFSFPYGDETSAGEREFAICRELGLLTAVTTRKGLIHDRHQVRLTGLPRLSLNGDYQAEAYVEALLTGLPFALNNVLMHLAGRQAA